MELSTAHVLKDRPGGVTGTDCEVKYHARAK